MQGGYLNLSSGEREGRDNGVSRRKGREAMPAGRIVIHRGKQMSWCLARVIGKHYIFLQFRDVLLRID